MANIERLSIVQRKDIKKEIIYEDLSNFDGETWRPIFCYRASLQPSTYVQEHTHPEMKESFCVEEGVLRIFIESPEGEKAEIKLEKGSYYLVPEEHWHTLVNLENEDVSFLAAGFIKKPGGVTIDR